MTRKLAFFDYEGVLVEGGGKWLSTRLEAVRMISQDLDSSLTVEQITSIINQHGVTDKF